MTEEQKAYLDELRDSGEINMWGAPQYLQWEFGLTNQEARDIFKEWKDSFDEQV